MSSGHILYIPLILFLGAAVGFALGRQAGGRQVAAAARRVQQREARVARLKSELGGQGSSPAGDNAEGTEEGA